jgi:hypothetical protein
MKNKAVLFLIALVIYCSSYAQEFLSPSNTFSHEQTAYIVLTDGTEIQGTIDDIDRKKGLIKFIKITDTEGKVHELQPEAVKNMYIPPSGLDKVQKAANFASDTQKWNNEKLNEDLFSKGYSYFELGNVEIKKETQKLLMQLLNPSFSEKIKVYYDPFANSTSSLGIGGINVVGGIAKSYYVAYSDEKMIKLDKKSYEDRFSDLYQGCAPLLEKFPDPKWRDFAEHITAFSDCND